MFLANREAVKDRTQQSHSSDAGITPSASSASLFEKEQVDTQVSFEDAVASALGSGMAQLCLVDEDTVGGTYYLKVPGTILGVFKPSNEEAAMQDNPRGLTTRDSMTRIGCTPGQGWKNEIAAFLLDKGFAGVPETIEYTMPGSLLGRPGPITGSLQKYLENAGVQSWDVLPGPFSSQDIRKIAILDLRLLNCDRHGGNMLVRNGNNLIPIDHGYVLPDSSISDLDYEWLSWNQCKTSFDSEELRFIASCHDLLQHDLELLRCIGITSSSVLELFAIATKALYIGACFFDLTAYQLGHFFRRQRLNQPSSLELVIQKSRTELKTPRSRKSPTLGGDIDLRVAEMLLREEYSQLKQVE